jgi:hypothetical protein
MNKNQLPIMLYLALGLHLSLGLYPSVTQAQTPTRRQPTRTNFKLPKPPVVGIPPKRKPAGTRGPCEEATLPFTPVLPNPDPDFSGLTLASHPTFWFYVPYQSDRVKSARFSLETEEEGMSIWRNEFKLPRTPGFVSVTLPQSVKGLTEGQIYRWHFTIYCDSQEDSPLSSEQQPSIVFHKGLIKRAKKSDFPANLNQNSLDFYLKHKIWYDAANQLTETRKSAQQWSLFLERMDMSAWQEEKISGAL